MIKGVKNGIIKFFCRGRQSSGLPEALLEYRAGFIDKDDSDLLLEKFIREAPWKQTT